MRSHHLINHKRTKLGATSELNNHKLYRGNPTMLILGQCPDEYDVMVDLKKKLHENRKKSIFYLC